MTLLALLFVATERLGLVACQFCRTAAALLLLLLFFIMQRPPEWSITVFTATRTSMRLGDDGLLFKFSTDRLHQQSIRAMRKSRRKRRKRVPRVVCLRVRVIFAKRERQIERQNAKI